MHEEWYVVQTSMGSFKLDRESYRDYLAGKLWICHKAAESPAPAVRTAAELPSEVSREAVLLREAAARRGVYETLQERYPGEQVPIPYRTSMGGAPIGEMPLSTRAANGLQRAGVHSFEKLFALMRDRGLRSVRSLGEKTEREIVRKFFTGCYAKLTPAEQVRYWQDLLDAKSRGFE